MNSKNLSIALFFALFCFSVNAQVSEGGTPLSFIRTVELTPNVPVIKMPNVDVAALMREDSLNVDKEIPYRFGYNHYVFVTPENSGEWTTLKHGERVWRLGIKCPDALSINIAFAKFIIPEGAKLFIYSSDRKYVLGAFTSKNMQPDGQFGVDIVPGEEIVVEYNEPAKVAFKGQLNIFRITHAYRDLFKIAKAFGSSGNCHNNVVCPVGDPWANKIKSVALITVNGSGICTGALINNANQDATPYFLTAHHCTSGGGSSTWVFRFNYNSPTCTPSANGPTGQTVSGSTMKADASGSDFSLLQLNSTPPQSYNVCYAGWSRSNVPPTSGAGIHHPSGDVKKISFSTQSFDSTSWSGNINNHWLVYWSSGVTEPGSSGSPMFDQNHHLVGQLHGGPSACGAQQADLNDDYGKVYYSWDKNGNTAATRLKDWLDPNNTGLMSIDTYCPGQVVTPTSDAVAQSLILPLNGLCDTAFTPGVVVNNSGTQTITSLTFTWTLDGGSTQTTTINNLSIVASATDTIYLPQITYQGGNHAYNTTITLVNGLPDGVTNNNTANGNFTSSSGITYHLAITTDGYADETGFAVIAANGDTVYSIPQGTLANSTTVNYDFCLAAGCYTFIANDAFGDGMCCAFGNGSFTLTDNSNFTIASGAQYGFYQSFPFCTTLNTNDAAIDTIIAPQGTLCISTAVPKIVIRNQGQQPLTQLSIGFSLNGNAPGNYLWSGSLAYNQTDTVILGVLTAPPGPNIITIYTYSPNGQTDENMYNDTLSASFVYAQGSTVTINLTTDDLPDETAWTVINSVNNSVVYQSPQTVPPPYLPNSNNKIELCLPNGCYKFIITDAGGDGICCANGNGAYTVIAPNTGIIGSGGQFNDADTVIFCLPFVGVTENKINAVKVFPNPATGNLYLDFGSQIKENLIVEMINAQGQLVQTNTVQNTNVASINVATLPTGFYIIRMYGQTVKPFTTTVIVKN